MSEVPLQSCTCRWLVCAETNGSNGKENDSVVEDFIHQRAPPSGGGGRASPQLYTQMAQMCSDKWLKCVERNGSNVLREMAPTESNGERNGSNQSSRSSISDQQAGQPEPTYRHLEKGLEFEVEEGHRV